MTGSTEKPTPLAEMTDEEKEREAERLFVLFQKLNENGIIKVMAKDENGNVRPFGEPSS